MPNEVNLAIRTDGLQALADMALAPNNQAQFAASWREMPKVNFRRMNLRS